MPTSEHPLNRRRLSLQRDSHNFLKQSSADVHNRSASIDVVQLAKEMRSKNTTGVATGRRLSLPFGRKLRKEINEQEIQCILTESVGRPVLSPVKPLTDPVMNDKHLQLLEAIKTALLDYQHSRMSYRVERLVL